MFLTLIGYVGVASNIIFEYIVEHVVGETDFIIFDHHYGFLQAFKDLLVLVVQLGE